MRVSCEPSYRSNPVACITTVYYYPPLTHSVVSDFSGDVRVACDLLLPTLAGTSLGE